MNDFSDTSDIEDYTAPAATTFDGVDNTTIDDSSVDTPVQSFSGGGANSQMSLVDSFKQELQELAESNEVFIKVKGYEQTGLQIKYHLPENGKELDALERKVMRETKETYTRNLYVAMDTMVHLCDGLYVQPVGIDEPVMLDPNESGVAVDFGDPRLAELMGFSGEQGNSAPTARAMIRKLFGGSEHEMAILDHAERLSRWIRNVKSDLDAEIWQLGE